MAHPLIHLFIYLWWSSCTMYLMYVEEMTAIIIFIIIVIIIISYLANEPCGVELP